MKILSAEQIREADAYTIEHEPITSIDLMERAARACAGRIAALYGRHTGFHIFCGCGNNGGDGLAIARMLSAMKRKVTVFLIRHSENTTRDYATNLKRLETQALSEIHTIRNAQELKGKIKAGVIVDALLGTGLNKPVEGLLAEVIDFINSSGLQSIAIDIPSGLYCDKKPDHKHIVKASHTLTFQRPKLTFLFADFYPYVGDFEVLDIGLNEKFIESQASDFYYTIAADIAPFQQKRKPFSHKGNFGHAFLLAGSKGMMGAAVMSAKACLRSGAGLLTAHIPGCGYEIMQSVLPEAMVSTDDNDSLISHCPHLDKYNAIAAGPGLGTDKKTEQALKVLIQQATGPLVLDADALNILAQNKTWLSFVPPDTILTPHPKEFDRLAGTHTSDFERLESCREFAAKNRVIVILKGAYTAVVTPGKKIYFNSSGNPALAKGGSGDVLTGILLGLLARGYELETACRTAVFMHGRAADLFVKNNSEESMLAGDLVEMLPKVFLL
jgi:NAD(P)H-hydrate epimerase